VEGQSTREPDIVSVEAALSMFVSLREMGSHSIGLTMRTPGHDEQLAMGFLHSEGIIDSIADIVGVDATDDSITVHLTPGVAF
ncbi:uncharacterized protein METZ01_LOCUS266838, partial [marine metagenome]